MWIKKVFGQLKLPWKTVIVAAIILGIITAFIDAFVPYNNSLSQIAATVEFWLLIALIIIINCETPLEAACKNFIFFLISQPLVYLIQVPLAGWGLFSHYPRWFIMTLLTFPGSYIGWYIKKDTVASGLILSVALMLLIAMGVEFTEYTINHFPYRIISAIYCLGLVPVLIYGTLNRKEPRVVAIVLSMLALILFVSLKIW